MVHHEPDAVVLFTAKIDCRFPYGDRALASALIEEGRSISLEASFCVLEQICRKPKSDRVTPKRQQELIEEWAAGFEHTLKEPMLHCARTLTEKQRLSWQEAVGVMEQIGQSEAQYAALNIAYFSGECDSDEGATQLEAAHNRIRLAWSERAAMANDS
jgi:hypothetical protein